MRDIPTDLLRVFVAIIDLRGFARGECAARPFARPLHPAIRDMPAAPSIKIGVRPPHGADIASRRP